MLQVPQRLPVADVDTVETKRGKQPSNKKLKLQVESVYDDYFGWSRGYTTKINQENMFPITKAKVALMSKQEKLKIATAFYSHCRV